VQPGMVVVRHVAGYQGCFARDHAEVVDATTRRGSVTDHSAAPHDQSAVVADATTTTGGPVAGGPAAVQGEGPVVIENSTARADFPAHGCVASNRAGIQGSATRQS
jgi:hypothetical protein